MPTQIGSTVLLLTSFKMTIGMLVAGSIMRPRLFLFGNLVAHGERRRVRARRIFEAEQRVVLDLIEQRQRLVEIRFGLARKAYDNVGRDGDVAPRTLQPIDAPHVFVARVKPV